MIVPKKKIEARQLELRARLWPEITDDDLWFRQKSAGYATVPRAMPLMLAIMDEMAKGKHISSTYFELFCRGFDDCMIVLNKPREMAFHAGLTGQRAERTWREKLRILNELGFIKIKEGPSGAMSYALMLNPYKVIKSHYVSRHPGITSDRYNALLARVSDIGAQDLDDLKKTDAKPVEKTEEAKPVRKQKIKKKAFTRELADRKRRNG